MRKPERSEQAPINRLTSMLGRSLSRTVSERPKDAKKLVARNGQKGPLRRIRSHLPGIHRQTFP
jgi:hypothetical protein